MWRLSEAFTPYGTSLVRDTASTGVGIALRYRWTGREYDAETGFYYLRARYYSPTLRRFVAEDPIGESGGNNLYAYAGGTPLEATDPSGLAPGEGGGTGAGTRWEAANALPPQAYYFACYSWCGDRTEWNWGLTLEDPLAFKPWWKGTVIIFHGRKEDKTTCLANTQCADEWNQVQNSGITQWVEILYNPTLPEVARSKYSQATNSWLMQYNPGEFKNGAVYVGVKVVDGLTTFTHEFAHILFNDMTYRDTGVAATKCASATRATAAENVIRLTRPNYYGIRPDNCDNPVRR